jgi:hypothetical protein
MVNVTSRAFLAGVYVVDGIHAVAAFPAKATKATATQSKAAKEICSAFMAGVKYAYKRNRQPLKLESK